MHSSLFRFPSNLYRFVPRESDTKGDGSRTIPFCVQLEVESVEQLLFHANPARVGLTIAGDVTQFVLAVWVLDVRAYATASYRVCGLSYRTWCAVKNELDRTLGMGTTRVLCTVT